MLMWTAGVFLIQEDLRPPLYRKHSVERMLVETQASPTIGQDLVFAHSAALPQQLHRDQSLKCAGNNLNQAGSSTRDTSTSTIKIRQSPADMQLTINHIIIVFYIKQGIGGHKYVSSPNPFPIGSINVMLNKGLDPYIIQYCSYYN